jgi:hypothetical protein
MRRPLFMAIFTLTAMQLLLVPVALASSVPAGGAPQQFGVRLYDVPVVDAHNPRGLRYIVDYVHPGSVIRRRILIVNQETRPSRFSVYPDAARIRQGMFIGDAGATRSELTQWVTVGHPLVRLRAGAKMLDMITIRVPGRATGGEHYGVVWVQQAARVRAAGGDTIVEVARVGIRIYLDVGKGGLPPTRFVISGISGRRKPDGQPVLAVSIHNVGGLAVDVNGQEWLSQGPASLRAGPFRGAQVVTLAPGQTGTMTFAQSRQLPAGPWLAKVVLVSGLTSVSALSPILFPGASASRLATAWPAGGLIGGVLVIVLVMAGLLIRRIRGARGRPRPTGAG